MIAVYTFTGLFMRLFGLLALTRESFNIVMFIAGLTFLLLSAFCFGFAGFIYNNIRTDMPITVLTAEGFSGRHNFRWKDYPWTPETYLFRVLTTCCAWSTRP